MYPCRRCYPVWLYPPSGLAHAVVAAMAARVYQAPHTCSTSHRVAPGQPTRSLTHQGLANYPATSSFQRSRGVCPYRIHQSLAADLPVGLRSLYQEHVSNHWALTASVVSIRRMYRVRVGEPYGYAELRCRRREVQPRRGSLASRRAQP
jgi:hypothetical protein